MLSHLDVEKVLESICPTLADPNLTLSNQNSYLQSRKQPSPSTTSELKTNNIFSGTDGMIFVASPQPRKPTTATARNVAVASFDHQRSRSSQSPSSPPPKANYKNQIDSVAPPITNNNKPGNTIITAVTRSSSSPSQSHHHHHPPRLTRSQLIREENIRAKEEERLSKQRKLRQTYTNNYNNNNDHLGSQSPQEKQQQQQQQKQLTQRSISSARQQQPEDTTAVRSEENTSSSRTEPRKRTASNNIMLQESNAISHDRQTKKSASPSPSLPSVSLQNASSAAQLENSNNKNVSDGAGLSASVDPADAVQMNRNNNHRTKSSTSPSQLHLVESWKKIENRNQQGDDDSDNSYHDDNHKHNNKLQLGRDTKNNNTNTNHHDDSTIMLAAPPETQHYYAGQGEYNNANNSQQHQHQNQNESTTEIIQVNSVANSATATPHKYRPAVPQLKDNNTHLAGNTSSSSFVLTDNSEVVRRHILKQRTKGEDALDEVKNETRTSNHQQQTSIIPPSQQRVAEIVRRSSVSAARETRHEVEELAAGNEHHKSSRSTFMQQQSREEIQKHAPILTSRLESQLCSSTSASATTSLVSHDAMISDVLHEILSQRQERRVPSKPAVALTLCASAADFKTCCFMSAPSTFPLVVAARSSTSRKSNNGNRNKSADTSTTLDVLFEYLSEIDRESQQQRNNEVLPFPKLDVFAQGTSFITFKIVSSSLPNSSSSSSFLLWYLAPATNVLEKWTGGATTLPQSTSGNTLASVFDICLFWKRRQSKPSATDTDEFWQFACRYVQKNQCEVILHDEFDVATPRRTTNYYSQEDENEEDNSSTNKNNIECSSNDSFIEQSFISKINNNNKNNCANFRLLLGCGVEVSDANYKISFSSSCQIRCILSPFSSHYLLWQKETKLKMNVVLVHDAPDRIASFCKASCRGATNCGVVVAAAASKADNRENISRTNFLEQKNNLVDDAASGFLLFSSSTNASMTGNDDEECYAMTKVQVPFNFNNINTDRAAAQASMMMKALTIAGDRMWKGVIVEFPVTTNKNTKNDAWMDAVCRWPYRYPSLVVVVDGHQQLREENDCNFGDIVDAFQDFSLREGELVDTLLTSISSSSQEDRE